MDLTIKDVETIEDWWVQKSRSNFLAYRMFMRYGNFEHNWFIDDLCKQLQQFYVDLTNGLRPILIINTPPQHGKSWAISDFISWISGKRNNIRTIYATYSDSLGKRCNLGQQRFMDSDKYKKIFPETNLSQKRGVAIKNTEHLEYLDSKGATTEGQFRNTTTNGRVNGESLDLGVIDDSVKGRKEANSITVSQGIWEWFTDDFNTRFSKLSGLIVIMTRWTTHDLVERIVDIKKNFKGRKFTHINYQAIATQDEEHRKEGDPLFPELKPLEFLNDQQATMAQGNWEAIYQGNPTIDGGNLIKDKWWKWWKTGFLPPLKYKFIVADTAQKEKEINDWTVFQCWGYGINGNLYLIDILRGKFESPELRVEAEIFYNKHNTHIEKVGDPRLRAMYIEDKSSGSGLIQELRKKKLKIIEVPRNKDKVLRCNDQSPHIENGRVYLNVDIPHVGNLTKEGREFPAGKYDDNIDTAISAIDIAYTTRSAANMLQAAMEAA